MQQESQSGVDALMKKLKDSFLVERKKPCLKAARALREQMLTARLPTMKGSCNDH